MNKGWYAIYLLAIAIASAMSTFHGYNISTWQYWVWFGLIVISFIAGSEYRNKEN